MTKTISNGNPQKYNLNVNNEIVICLTSKLITCLIDGVNLEMKSYAFTFLLSGSGHFGLWRWNALGMNFVDK